MTLEEQTNSKGCRCTVELKIKSFELCVKGVGISIIEDYRIIKKLAFHRACENAFSQVGLVLSPQGKVANAATTIQLEQNNP